MGWNKRTRSHHNKGALEKEPSDPRVDRSKNMNFFTRRISERGMLIKQVSLCDPAGEEPHREVINRSMPPPSKAASRSRQFTPALWHRLQLSGFAINRTFHWIVLSTHSWESWDNVSMLAPACARCNNWILRQLLDVGICTC